MGLGALGGLGAIGALGTLGGLHIKVEHYAEGEEIQLHNSQTSSSEEEEEDEEDEEDMQDCDTSSAANKLQKRRKRRKVQKWDGNRSRRLRQSSTTPSPDAMGDTAPLVDPAQAASTTASSHLLASGADSPNTTAPASSVLKIKTEMAEPINFDNDSSIWNYPPNREISRNESPYSMTAKPAAPTDTFPSPQGGALQVAIPESVLTPPGTEGGAGGVRKPPYNGSSAPSSTSSSLAPPSSASTADPLSPPLSASPRDKGTPTTSSTSSTSSSSSSSSSSSLLYSGDLEALQRLQAGNVVLPLVHRVTGSLASTISISHF